METCKKKFLNIILSLFLIFIFTNFSYASQTFKQLENKKVSYLDFFLLKFENTITKRAQILRRQAFATRVQYSNIGIQVNFNEKEINFLLGKMFVNVTILHPIKKRELSCYGKVNDYELK